MWSFKNRFNVFVAKRFTRDPLRVPHILWNKIIQRFCFLSGRKLRNLQRQRTPGPSGPDRTPTDGLEKQRRRHRRVPHQDGRRKDRRIKNSEDLLFRETARCELARARRSRPERRTWRGSRRRRRELQVLLRIQLGESVLLLKSGRSHFEKSIRRKWKWENVGVDPNSVKRLKV